MKICDIPIYTGSPATLDATVELILRGKRFRRIATVNPEFLVRAYREAAFQRNLRQADICVADGTGVALVLWIRGGRFARIPGADLLEQILKHANNQALTVYCALRADGLSSLDAVRHALIRRFPRLTVLGGVYPETELLTLQALPCAHIILCNFGAPEQEYFCESLRQRAPETRLVIGVGGALDFLTGKRRRAPRPLRQYGFEWLWRLVISPRRIGRIVNATAVFFWYVLFGSRKKSG